ncbi:MAG: tRNA lysidine(34) synthetase TilS, partial [Acidobacteriota bacterium]
MSMILATFLDAFRAHFADLVGRPVLVALSGGADSVALLTLLASGRNELGCPVAACHVHHHLRGADADADARHCEELCRALHLSLALRHLRPEPPRGVSPESWWRRLRYVELEAARREANCDVIATGHTLDDQAETVLMKLLAGAGPRGVAGVRRRRGAIIRPLLDLHRSQAREWLVEQGVAWREDASNAATEPPRAWLRHVILPAIASHAPKAAEKLAAFAAILAEDEELLGSLLRDRGRWPEVEAPVPLAAVRSLPAPLRRRWALELADRLPLQEPLARAQLAAIEALLAGGQPRAVDLGRRWVLRRAGRALELDPPPWPASAPRNVSVPSEEQVPSGMVVRLGMAWPGAGSEMVGLHPRVRGLTLR